MKSSCNCRVGLDEILAEVRVDELPGVTLYAVLPDWRGEPSLSVSDAAAYVARFRAERAARQARQDELDASRAAREAAKRDAEARFWAARQRESRREAAIRKGAAAAVDSLRGLVTPERQAIAYSDGAAVAAEVFDEQYPEVPA